MNRIIILILIFIYFIFDKKDDNYGYKLKKLVRSSARYSTAAEQDNNALIAVLHANYGAGYLWALKEIASKKEIESLTGIDLDKFTENVLQIQDKVTKKAIIKCPVFAPQRTYLSKFSGEG